MSSVVLKSSGNSRPTQLETLTYEVTRLHIPEYDRKRGIPVEERFRAVLLQIEPVVFAYRRNELTDGADAAEMAEEAIYKANWALYGRPCDNVAGYVLTIFRRDVDEYLRRGSKIESLEEHVARCSATVCAVGSAGQVEHQILVREALDLLDDMTRWICLRRFIDGESPATIGRELGISANVVSVRLSRGLDRIRALFKVGGSVK